ncbi:MAG: hypothetical protein WCW84_13330 [Sulfurimonas sp.]|jgi:hypothetical protein
MAITKNIIDIINVQNSCKDVIQELYNYESRPNTILRANYKYAKIDEAIRFEILEYDNYDDALSLSSDTEEYYRTRLGQNSETYIGLIGDKISKLNGHLLTYNIRIRNQESADKEIQSIYKILNQIPSHLKFNLHTIASNSVFAFKNEPNFEIKMIKLKLCQEEIKELIDASSSVDSLLAEQYHFFRAMVTPKINATILKLKHNSAQMEGSFRQLYDDIKNFINQSIKDGEFIKKLQILKNLKDENKLLEFTNIEEYSKNKPSIATNIREKRIHPDDKIHDYIDTILQIIESRALEFKNKKDDVALSYDIEAEIKIEKTLYNYQELHSDFLAQEKDLISFLIQNNIAKERILGVFVRMLKNYAPKYQINSQNFVKIDTREYIEIFSTQREGV